MKNITTTIFILFLISSISFGQESEKSNNMTYRIGTGVLVEGNVGMYGFNVINELSFKVKDRFSINPSLTFYHSIINADFNYTFPEDREQFVSGIFTDVRFQYDLIRTKKDFRVGLAFGPSFQFGGEAIHRGYHLNADEPRVEESLGFTVESHRRLGYVSQVTFDWQPANPNRRNTIGVSMSSFDGYWPYYLMVNYRLGFKL
ncbi:hypothetical protein MMU07_00015 [Aquiflexum sp. LQ15W]|uniref:hypothetical protein n=1 Tax=Cognataquiflexum nitidum TaxID=2922272 RepID=UPI001F132845|nr:hypothetical protein [Cognataquiflexum nitidum]MCH6197943.1 hypothetical protein [Cognataquiflexum nitidum]